LQDTTKKHQLQMKKKLFNILPTWIKKFKHADKVAHAIYGTIFYLLANLLLSPDLSLFTTVTLALGVEVYDKHGGGKADVLDFLATIIIPIILYIIV
jgi:hypothetical protein